MKSSDNLGRKLGWIRSITLGLIRDQTMRHNAMFVLLLVALVMLFVGATLLQGILLERPLWFIFYWLACAWFTFSGALLAVYDLLIMRVQRRVTERILREDLRTKLETLKQELDAEKPAHDDKPSSSHRKDT